MSRFPSLLILLAVPLLGQQAGTAPEKCALAGTAVDAITNAPLAKVEIVAELLSGHDPGASTTTDTKGNFRLVDVDPGQYRISAKRNGYLDTYFGAKKSSTHGSTITLTAGQNAEDLQIRLSPFGVIAGTVRDADGEAIAHVMVDLSVSKFSNGQRRIAGEDSTETNDLGEFRFADLSPGRYYISAKPQLFRSPPVDHSAKSDTAPEFPLRTFYPDTADPAAAAPIDLDAGAHFANANVTLLRAALYTVSAHVEVPAGMKPAVTIGYSAEELDTLGQASGDKDNNVTIRGIPSGSWVLRASARPPDKPFDGTVDMWADRGLCNVVSVPLIVDHANVDGLRASVKACGQVTGHVVLSDENKQEPPAKILFGQLFTGDRSETVRIKTDGSFQASVSSGPHSISFPDVTGGHLYVRSLRAGNQDILRNGFSVGDAEQFDLEVVLASDGGALSGTANNAEDKPAAGATVVLIPNDPALRARRDFTWNTTADQAGHFEFRGVAPGDYKVFAWDDIEEGGWFDPEVLKNIEDKGEPVSVRARDTSSAITLRVIP